MLKLKDYTAEEIQRKREEAERKARRGEIDPMQEYTFSMIAKVHLIYLLFLSDDTSFR